MKIIWNAKDVLIAEVSERERKDEKTQEMIKYKVVKFCQKKDEKRSCLCFSEHLSRMLGIGLFCELQGEVSFGSGSTYLVMKSLTEAVSQDRAAGS
jgi:hypothetical protein